MSGAKSLLNGGGVVDVEAAAGHVVRQVARSRGVVTHAAVLIRPAIVNVKISKSIMELIAGPFAPSFCPRSPCPVRYLIISGTVGYC